MSLLREWTCGVVGQAGVSRHHVHRVAKPDLRRGCGTRPTRQHHIRDLTASLTLSLARTSDFAEHQRDVQTSRRTPRASTRLPIAHTHLKPTRHRNRARAPCAQAPAPPCLQNAARAPRRRRQRRNQRQHKHAPHAPTQLPHTLLLAVRVLLLLPPQQPLRSAPPLLRAR